MAPRSCPAAVLQPESRAAAATSQCQAAGGGARGPGGRLSRATGTPACNRRPAPPATCLPGSRVRGRGLRRGEWEEPVAELLQQQQRLHRQQPAVLVRVLLRHICEDRKECTQCQGTGLSLHVTWKQPRCGAPGLGAQPGRCLSRCARTAGKPAKDPTGWAVGAGGLVGAGGQRKAVIRTP